MREMNRSEWAFEYIHDNYPILKQQEETNPHDFYTQSHTGILYKRKSVSARRLFFAT